METLYTEGVAIHGGPESCVGDPRGRSEALTGVHVGRAIEPRNNHFGVPTLSHRRKATLLRRYREPLVDPRGRRTRACVEPSCARTGRSHDRPTGG